jgi:uncharacterized membrane protein YgcG
MSRHRHRNRHRVRRLLGGLLLGLALTLGLQVAGSSVAWAAGDEIDAYTIEYAMTPDGVLQAKETIVYRFGDDSGRHGIERYFITREPYNDTEDQVFQITNIEVEASDGVSDQFSSTTYESKGGREEQLRLRIGDPDETISADTATYVISYQVRGAMRSFPSYDEFYWDATGFDWEATIKQVEIRARVPGGAQELTCFVGAVGSKQACTNRIEPDETAQFSASNVPPGQGVTIGVKIRSGLVTNNTPILVPDGSQLTAAERTGLVVLGVGAVVLIVGSPLVGFLWWRKNGRDQRYAGLAPGVTPLAGQPAHVVANDPDIVIPVAFSPPRIPVAEAGLLVDGQVDTRETAATIIDLAVRGALTVQSTDENEFRVTLVDPARAAAPHEMVLLNALFSGQPPGAVADLSAQGSLTAAHQALQTSVRNQVASRGWFRKVPSASATAGTGFGVIAIILFGLFGLGVWVLWIVLPLLPVIITWLVIRFKLRRGQRTADGRAVTDQIEGFRTYLATAEADQLRFEEGEDIFSKYLPWAIVFELADRWAKICGDLVAIGRLPNEVPYWYIGNYNMAAFNTSFITSSLTTAATPAPSAGSSGTGFGGGSSFGGGGFSGGGGGGGGGGSW